MAKVAGGGVVILVWLASGGFLGCFYDDKEVGNEGKWCCVGCRKKRERGKVVGELILSMCVCVCACAYLSTCRDRWEVHRKILNPNPYAYEVDVDGSREWLLQVVGSYVHESIVCGKYSTQGEGGKGEGEGHWPRGNKRGKGKEEK